MTEQPITPAQLDALERVVDKVFANLNIDVEFTKHFLDQVNNERNKKQITLRELGELFAKEYKRWGNTLKHMPVDTQAVMKDLSSAINIPFVLNKDEQGKELVAKTVMRKKDFKTPNKTLPVESVTEASGKVVKTVNGYPIHDMGEAYPYKDKRFMIRDPKIDVWSSSAPTLRDAVAKANSLSPRQASYPTPSPADLEHEAWRDEQRARLATGEVRRAVMSRRGYTPEAIMASWENYRDLDEKLIDPREAILQKALNYLDRKVQAGGERQSLGGYAFDVAREVNLMGIATAKELATMYRDWKGDSVVTEGWMESNLYYLDEVIREDDDPCWDGYRQLGTKKKKGKEVPNCVPKKKK